MIDQKFFGSPVQKNCFALGIVRAKFFQRTQILRADAICVFYLDRVNVFFSVQNKIDFDAALRTPIIHFIGIILVCIPGKKMLSNQSFEGRTDDLFRTIKRTFWTKTVKYAGVENIKFWSGDQSALCAFSKDRKSKRKQYIFEYLDKSLYGFALDFTLSGYITDIQKRGVRKADSFEEAGKICNITNQTLLLNFLTNVKSDIRIKGLFGIFG